MQRYLIGTAAAFVLLAACGEAGTPGDTQSIEVPEGDYQARLLEMPEGQRDAVFIRAIRDAGFDCQGVESSTFLGDSAGAPTWQATCDDGEQWTIVIGNAGIAQVANSAALQNAGGGATQTAPEAAGQ